MPQPAEHDQARVSAEPSTHSAFKTIPGKPDEMPVTTIPSLSSD